MPESKIRERHRRLWRHIAEAVPLVAETRVCDNSSPDEPFRRVACFRKDKMVGVPEWPNWAPTGLVLL